MVLVLTKRHKINGWSTSIGKLIILNKLLIIFYFIKVFFILHRC